MRETIAEVPSPVESRFFTLDGVDSEPGGSPRVRVPCRFTREMGLTHEEFFRELPAALGHREYVAEARRASGG